MGCQLTPSHDEQSKRSLETEKFSEVTPSEGGRSSGLPNELPAVPELGVVVLRLMLCSCLPS